MLTLSAVQVPYLGALTNEGGWQDLSSIFLEPFTTSFDRSDAARYHGQGTPEGWGGTDIAP